MSSPDIAPDEAEETARPTCCACGEYFDNGGVRTYEEELSGQKLSLCGECRNVFFQSWDEIEPEEDGAVVPHWLFAGLKYFVENGRSALREELGDPDEWDG